MATSAATSRESFTEIARASVMTSSGMEAISNHFNRIGTTTAAQKRAPGFVGAPIASRTTDLFE
jgi:hypothetical protein